MRPALPFHYDLFLKFRFHFRYLFGNPNFDRSAAHFPLHFVCIPQIQFRCGNYTRSMIRMNCAIHPHKWSFRIFFIHLPPLIPGNILPKRSAQESLGKWCIHHNPLDGNLFPRLRSTLGANILLSSGCYYQPFICNPYSWGLRGSLSMRRFRRKSPHLNPILFTTLSTPFHPFLPGTNPFNFFALPRF